MGSDIERAAKTIAELIKHSKDLAGSIRMLDDPSYIAPERDNDAEGFGWTLSNHANVVREAQEVLVSLGEEPELAETDLERWRRTSADQVFENFDFTYDVATSNGWEYSTGDDIWTQTVFLADNENPDGDTIKGVLRVEFEPGTNSVQSCSALINGSEVIEDTMGLSEETKGMRP